MVDQRRRDDWRRDASGTRDSRPPERRYDRFPSEQRRDRRDSRRRSRSRSPTRRHERHEPFRTASGNQFTATVAHEVRSHEQQWSANGAATHHVHATEAAHGVRPPGVPEAELVPYDPWADVGKPLSTLEAVSGTASGPDIPGPPAPSTSTAHTTGAANESAHTQTSDQPVFAPAAATAAAAAAGFLPEWSTAMKGGNVSVRSPLLAEVTGNTFKVSTAVLSSQPIASTTTASTLYFEVTIAGPGKAKGDVLHSGTFIGLVAHTRTTSARVHSSRGVWGLRATCDHNALRLNGQSRRSFPGTSATHAAGLPDAWSQLHLH